MNTETTHNMIKYTGHCTSVLELGAGLFGRIDKHPAKVKVGIEIHKPYIENRLCSNNVIPLCLDATKIDSVLPDRFFEAVVLIDFIEHLEKNAGYKLLDTLDRFTKDIIFIHCPIGVHPQDKDVWNLGGEIYQKHRSEWYPEDFQSRGYEVIVFNKYSKPNTDPRALFAIKQIKYK